MQCGVFELTADVGLNTNELAIESLRSCRKFANVGLDRILCVRGYLHLHMRLPSSAKNTQNAQRQDEKQLICGVLIPLRFYDMSQNHRSDCFEPGIGKMPD